MTRLVAFAPLAVFWAFFNVGSHDAAWLTESAYVQALEYETGATAVAEAPDEFYMQQPRRDRSDSGGMPSSSGMHPASVVLSGRQGSLFESAPSFTTFGSAPTRGPPPG